MNIYTLSDAQIVIFFYKQITHASSAAQEAPATVKEVRKAAEIKVVVLEVKAGLS